MSEETPTENGGETSEPAVEQAAETAPEQASLPEFTPEPEQRRAVLEAIVYVAEEPLTARQIADGLKLPLEQVEADLAALIAEGAQKSRGIEVRSVAGGYKMFTKAEYHEAVRQFVKTLRPNLKLSPAALETLSVIAYKQPVTVPEIQAIRGVNAAGVIHTLLRHKLVSTAGRKKVVGKPMLYKTTREFLVQFGLSDVSELPSLKELEELSRAALGEDEEIEIEAETTATEVEDAVEPAEKTDGAEEGGEAEEPPEPEADSEQEITLDDDKTEPNP